jgi:hypothetical protein
MTVPARPLDEIRHAGMTALIRELGVADALRFIAQYTTGQGDYTTERQAWLAELPLDHVLEQARRVDAGRTDTGD